MVIGSVISRSLLQKWALVPSVCVPSVLAVQRAVLGNTHGLPDQLQLGSSWGVLVNGPPVVLRINRGFGGGVLGHARTPFGTVNVVVNPPL